MFVPVSVLRCHGAAALRGAFVFEALEDAGDSFFAALRTYRRPKRTALSHCAPINTRVRAPGTLNAVRPQNAGVAMEYHPCFRSPFSNRKQSLAP